MSTTDPRPGQQAGLPSSLSLHRLIGMIEALVPEDAEEAKHRQRMLELAAGGKNALSRHHYHPGHFTASAFVLNPDQTSLLFVFHRRLDKWLQPGGHIDPGDVDVFAAARREVVEETGVNSLEAPEGPPALFDLDVHSIPARGSEPLHEHFDLRILLRSHRTKIQPDSDARDARWVGMSEIGSLDTDASVLRAVEKVKRRLVAGAIWAPLTPNQ